MYDPAFVHHDPRSSTRTLQPNERDLTYSKYRPDLAALGAVDGFMPSGLPIDNNDPLSRRDAGLEFLDVTGQVHAALIDSDRRGSRRQEDAYKFTNNSSSIVDTHLLVVVKGLSRQIRLANASGTTSTGDPYLRVFLPDGTLLPGQSTVVKLTFEGRHDAPPAKYSLSLLSGQGKP